MSLALSAALFSGAEANAADLSAWNMALSDLGRGPAAVMSLSGITFGFAAPTYLINSTYLAAPVVAAATAVPTSAPMTSGTLSLKGVNTSTIQNLGVTLASSSLSTVPLASISLPKAPVAVAPVAADPPGPPRDDNPAAINPPAPPSVKPVVSNP